MHPFTPEQLRAVINGLSNSPCVVLYESHFTVIEPHLSMVDLENILLEFETGVLSILNQAEIIWSTDIDLARELALSLPQEASQRPLSPETESMDPVVPRCQRDPYPAWEESKSVDQPENRQCPKDTDAPTGPPPIEAHPGDQSNTEGEHEVSWGPRKRPLPSNVLSNGERVTTKGFPDKKQLITQEAQTSSPDRGYWEDTKAHRGPRSEIQKGGL
jgi:hypothetical protein